jgi:hypothetical protein
MTPRFGVSVGDAPVGFLRRLLTRARGLPSGLWIPVLACPLLVVFGRGYAGYDAVFSLIWGREIAHLQSPDLAVTFAPTPHPLANLLGAALAPLGGGAIPSLTVASALALALLGWAGYRLGSGLFSPAVGLVLASLLLSRPLLVELSLSASIDVLFLALVTWATAEALVHSPRPRAALVLLALAGLLRPEAWTLSVAYGAWLMREPATRRADIVTLALAGPVIWAAADFVVTGDPFFSLRATRGLAVSLGPDRSLGAAVSKGPDYVDQILGEPVMWVGLAGCVATLVGFRRRAILPASLAALGTASFLAYGAAGVALYPRFLLVPATMLALFCAVAVAGWRGLEAGWRRAWRTGAVAGAVALLATAPQDADRLKIVTARAATRAEFESRLYDLVGAASARSSERRCRTLYIPSFRLAPLLVWWLDRDPDSISLGRPRPPGLVVAVASGRRLWVYPGEPIVGGGRPPHFRIVARNEHWVLYARC